LQTAFGHKQGVRGNSLSLIDDLEIARTEEDVKDAYIKALGFEGVVRLSVPI